MKIEPSMTRGEFYSMMKQLYFLNRNNGSHNTLEAIILNSSIKYRRFPSLMAQFSK